VRGVRCMLRAHAVGKIRTGKSRRAVLGVRCGGARAELVPAAALFARAHAGSEVLHEARMADGRQASPGAKENARQVHAADAKIRGAKLEPKKAGRSGGS